LFSCSVVSRRSQSDTALKANSDSSMPSNAVTVATK
jgi:hypothetical protein